MVLTRLLIVRHGNTFAPGQQVRRIGARSDLPLVDSGIAQARALGAWLGAAYPPAAGVLCGPLQRTRATARLLIKAAGLKGKPDVVAWLNEIDHGPDENRPEEDVVARVGDHALQAWERCGEVPCGWSPSKEDQIARWRQGVATLHAGTWIFVTSNGCARFAALALTPSTSPSRLKLRTGSFGELVSKAGGGDGFTLVKWDVRPGEHSDDV